MAMWITQANVMGNDGGGLMDVGDFFIFSFLFLYWLVAFFIYRLAKGWWAFFLGLTFFFPSIIGSFFVLYVRYFK